MTSENKFANIFFFNKPKNLMIERYNVPQIKAIWEEEEKFRRFLCIEKLFLEALEKFKIIPSGISEELSRVKISLKRIKKIEENTHHDIVAFLKHILQQTKRVNRYLHLGLTSSDLLDTTLAWQIKDATEIILQRLDTLIKEVRKKAIKYKDTICLGRTHGVAAEVYTLGLKFLYLYNDLLQERDLLKNSLPYVACAKISGALGTFSHFPPEVEKYICHRLKINSAAISTQIVSRERFAYYLSLLALLGSTLERFATEIRHLQRSEVAEVKEPFYSQQKGSSAMPHKQNPIICERICGLSRILRGNCLVAFENINLWHERDISHSSAERIILPDSTTLITYLIEKFTAVVKGLRVYPHNLLKNIELNRGLIYSQKLLLNLMKKGLGRQQAYDIVQKLSLKVINEGSSFKEVCCGDKTLKKYLKPEELKEIFNPHLYLLNIDKIYHRFGL